MRGGARSAVEQRSPTPKPESSRRDAADRVDRHRAEHREPHVVDHLARVLLEHRDAARARRRARERVGRERPERDRPEAADAHALARAARARRSARSAPASRTPRPRARRRRVDSASKRCSAAAIASCLAASALPERSRARCPSRPGACRAGSGCASGRCRRASRRPPSPSRAAGRIDARRRRRSRTCARAGSRRSISTGLRQRSARWNASCVSSTASRDVDRREHDRGGSRRGRRRASPGSSRPARAPC